MNWLDSREGIARNAKRMIGAVLRRMVPERYRPIGYLTRLVRQGTGGKVQHGPFAGMRYPDRASNSAYLPKLLGIYERELNPTIEEICTWQPHLVVDLGAAEGYYAAGLARRNPHARVIAFEHDHLARATLSQTLKLNGVEDRVRIEGRCRPADLNAVLQGHRGKGQGTSTVRKLVLCDVEGDEQTLLDPDMVPSLKHTRVLVETHEFVHEGITEVLLQRFEATHRVQQIWQEPRSTREFPFDTFWTALLPRSYLEWAVSEWRPCRMSWLWMKPRTRRDNNGKTPGSETARGVPDPGEVELFSSSIIPISSLNRHA